MRRESANLQKIKFVYLVLILCAPFRCLAQAPPQAATTFGSKGRSGSAVMDRLAPSRPPVGREVLEQLRQIPVEVLWGGLAKRGYEYCFVSQLRSTRPDEKLVGRAVTVRFLPSRPDLGQVVDSLARETGRSNYATVQAGDELDPGDVVVAEGLETKWFGGDVMALGMKMRGAAGLVVDGGVRDYSELRNMEGFPIYFRMLGGWSRDNVVAVEWNLPVRIDHVTVLPGDIVVGDASGLVFIPPQLAAELVREGLESEEREAFQRAKIKERKYPARDIYPQMSPEVEKEFRTQNRGKSLKK